MENDKIEGLKMSKGNFDANIQLSEMALAEISWWKENIMIQQAMAQSTWGA